VADSLLINVPLELRERPQWCACGPNKVPIDPKTRRYAAVDDPSTWGTFEQAVTAGFKHVGYMLSADDPFAIIDLDNKVEDPAPPEELERHESIVNMLDSYTERSASGRGTHIIVKGKVPKGVRRGHVELYSDLRFMICTGDVVRSKPVAERQEIVINMWSQMNPTILIDLSEDGEEEYTDREIHERALAAANGAKYDMLTRNDQDWRDHYGSQSEADLALIAMLTFYSKNNAQVKRLFRTSPLGRRDKAKREDYLDGMIRLCRTRQAESEPPPVDFNLATEIANSVRAQPAHTENEVYSFPPGLVGDVASYVLATSLQPSKEIALATSLGFLAAIAGRTYNTTTRSGLNLYLALLARTGYGKEHMKRSMERLIAKLRTAVPDAVEVIGPSHFASGQALIRVLNEHPCFISILGEFGITLKAWLDARVTSAERLISKMLLDLYGKSGADDALRPHVWADKEKNTQIIESPCLSILGESTPLKFYEAIDVTHIADGLVPRFIIIECEGPFPPFNDVQNVEPDPLLLQRLTALLTTVTFAKHNHTHHVVPQCPDAARALMAFRDVCRERVAADEQLGDIWNRAHLNALRVATLIAVGVDHQDPCVTLEHAEWAIRLIEHSSSRVFSRYDRGATGPAERDEHLDVAIRWWLQATPKQRADAKATKATEATDIMPFNFFRKRLKRVSAYREDRRGLDAAVKAQLDTYCEIGYLRKLSREEATKMGSSVAGLYAIGPEFPVD
jgi:hypothetical protein